MNCKAKGSKNERRSRDLLEVSGYQVTRAGGSLGVFDLIGISSSDVLLVQVKTNQWPSQAELESIKQFRCPVNARKLIHRWRDGERLPDVQEVR